MTSTSLPAHSETSSLGISYLKRFWALSGLTKEGKYLDTFEKEQTYLWALTDALGIGLEPTIHHLLVESPSFEEFQNWIAQNGNPSRQHIELFNKLIENPESAAAQANWLSQAQKNQWEQDGYVIIEQAISKSDAALTAELIYETLEAIPENPESWYKNYQERGGIMVQLFQHQLLQQNRFNPRVREAFEQLWNRTDLMVSCDRVSFNPPEKPGFEFAGPHLHWDVSLQTPIPYGTQGLIYLTDTSAEQGAFQLVAGFHKSIEEWLSSLKPGQDPRIMDLNHLKPIKLAAKAGDLIIWNQALPHGASPNTSNTPRLVQYVNYLPLDREVKPWK